MRNLLEEIVPQDWSKEGAGFQRTRWLQGVVDLINRPVANRQTVSTDLATVNLTGAVQSTGVGTGQLKPQRYTELTVKARVTFQLSGAGILYVYVHRTKGTVPANGVIPAVGDVIVGGDAFAGPATVGGQNMSAALSFLDSDLDPKQTYRYYLSLKGTNGLQGKLLNSSQLLVMERS